MAVVYLVGPDIEDGHNGYLAYRRKRDAVEVAKEYPGSIVERVTVARLPRGDLVIAAFNGEGWAESSEVVYQSPFSSRDLDG